ncbi:MAG: peptide ABC transporter substrate-binding protein, partial [Chloroflexota bacterium]|nr:peptide ABC transporter substrate-binding protein [Chloroflexota bacterium]
QSGGDWWRHPNGTGPFELLEWTVGQRLVLERHDGYYRGAAHVQYVTFRFTGSPMMLYETGEIDITQIGTTDIERALDPANVLNEQLLIVPQLSLGYVGFNNAIPPFDDEKVRQAFCHAVDKEGIISILLKNTVSPAYGILPPGIPGHDEGLEGLKYDVAQAQRLLAESSYREGLPPVVLAVPGFCTEVAPSAEALAWMWQENLGVDVEIQLVEWDTFFDELREGTLQAFEIGWIADYADAENFLDLLFHSESVENHTCYNNPVVDELLEEAGVEADVESRMATYQAAEHAIVEDAPLLPLWFERSYFLVKPYVEGFSPTPMVAPIYRDVRVDR